MSPVILINRPLIRNLGFHVSRRKWQPLNLLYIGTWLKNHGIPVKIIDARAMDYSSEDIAKILLWKKPEIVLIASDPYDFYQCPNPSIESFYEMTKIASEAGAKDILSFGPQATIFDQDLLKNTAINYIIKGDDPLTVACLIEDIIKGKRTIGYENVSFKENGKIQFGIIKHLDNLDLLPVADYNLLPMAKYSANIQEMPAGKFAIMTTSRGCPYQCKYCFKKLIGDKVRLMSLKRVRAELDELIIKNGVKVVYFLDDFFTFDFQRVNQICQLIIDKKYNLNWGCQTRPDMVNENLLKKMKGSGCIYISYGVETGCQAVADRSCKNLDLKTAADNIELTNRLGIQAHINMLYGFPRETKQEFNQTVNFLIHHKDFGLPGAIRFYPGTQYYQELIPSKSLTEMEKISTNLSLSKLNRTDIDRGLAKLILYKKIKHKEINWKILYYLLKYFFPSLVAKIKK